VYVEETIHLVPSDSHYMVSFRDHLFIFVFAMALEGNKHDYELVINAQLRPRYC
jgi:hypothetical protein